jgi:hypothetical protein
MLLLGHAVEGKTPFLLHIYAKTLRHREEAAGCPFYHPSLTLVAHFHHVCGISVSAHECLVMSLLFVMTHTFKVMFVICFVLENMSIEHAVKVMFVICFVLENMSIEHAVKVMFVICFVLENMSIEHALKVMFVISLY